MFEMTFEHVIMSHLRKPSKKWHICYTKDDLLDSEFHYRPTGIKNIWDVFRGALLRSAQDWQTHEREIKVAHANQMYGAGLPSIITTSEYPGISGALKKVRIRFV